MDPSTPLVLSRTLGTVQFEATANEDCDQQTYTWTYREQEESACSIFPRSYNENGKSRVLTLPVTYFDYGDYEIQVCSYLILLYLTIYNLSM